MADFVKLETNEISKYEQFQKKLFIDLQKVDSKLIQLETHLNDCQEVREFMNNKKSIEMMNIGAQTYVQVKQMNQDKIILQLELGICVEVSYEEAKTILSIKEQRYSEQIVNLNKKREEIQQYYQQVNDILFQLQI